MIRNLGTPRPGDKTLADILHERPELLTVPTLGPVLAEAVRSS